MREMERSPISKGGDIKSESAVHAAPPISEYALVHAEPKLSDHNHGHRHLPKGQREPLVKSEFAQAKADSNISDSQAKRLQKIFTRNLRLVFLFIYFL